MKVRVDQEGWAIAEGGVEGGEAGRPEGSTSAEKATVVPGSGVFAKVTPGSDQDLATMPTEPAPASEQASSSERLPPPPSVPADLAKTDDDDKVA